jgi:hypothetical protein
MRAGAAFAALSLAAAAALGAQEADDPHSAQPERPTVATHAYTVWPGYSEVEFGLQFDRLTGNELFSTPTTYKVGIAKRMQIEATFAWGNGSGDSGTVRGFTDVVVAFKWRLADSLPILGAFAIQPAVRLPTGSAAFTADAAVWSVLLISSQKLGPVELDVNFGTFAPVYTGDFPHLATLWTVSTSGPIRGKFGWTGEIYGFPGTSGPGSSAPLVGFLAAPTFQMHDWFVLDAGVIIPLSGPLPHSIFAGLTWNAGHF